MLLPGISVYNAVSGSVLLLQRCAFSGPPLRLAELCQVATHTLLGFSFVAAAAMPSAVCKATLNHQQCQPCSKHSVDVVPVACVLQV